MDITNFLKWVLPVKEESVSEPMDFVIVNEPNDVNKAIKDWFDTGCVKFANLPAERVLENDTQYDIDSLWEAFKIFHEDLTGIVPAYSLFADEVSQRCMKYKYSRYNEEEEIEY